jgi:hypothetical protein
LTNKYGPVGQPIDLLAIGPAYYSAYVRIHCLVIGPGLLGNRLVRQATGRPTGQQEVDDEVNSEVADVDSKVADGFIMILNIADEVITK